MQVPKLFWISCYPSYPIDCLFFFSLVFLYFSYVVSLACGSLVGTSSRLFVHGPVSVLCAWPRLILLSVFGLFAAYVVPD